MKKLILGCILAITAGAGVAHAHDNVFHGPYWIEKVCDSDWNCSPRMRYSPGQSPAGKPSYANYWYAPPSNPHFVCHLGRKRFKVAPDDAMSCPPYHLWWW